MSTALADLSDPTLAEICVRPPRPSTIPLSPAKYYPPGTSRASRIRTGEDADKIYRATLGQRVHLLQQLEEAERNARDALFALEVMDMELASETAAIQTSLSRLSTMLPPPEFEKMFDFGFGASKKHWETVWKHEWVEDDEERCKSATRPRKSPGNPRTKPSPPPQVPHPPSSPLPPSSPPPQTSPPNPQGRPLPLASPIHIVETPVDESQQPPRPHSPLAIDGLKTPWGIGNNSGSTGYRPNAPEPVAGPSRRLKRENRRLVFDHSGTPTVADFTEEVEAHRREIEGKIKAQARWRSPAENERVFSGGAQWSKGKGRTRDPPAASPRVFGDKEPEPKDPTAPLV